MKLAAVLGGLIGSVIPALMMVLVAQMWVLVSGCRSMTDRRPHGPTLIAAAAAVAIIG